jgi:hypothetical protein
MTVNRGKAIWHAKEGDQPVVIVGYLGESNGRHYVQIEGSDTGIPLDECEMEEREEFRESRRPKRRRIF